VSAPTPAARYERILSHYYDSELAICTHRVPPGFRATALRPAIRDPYEASDAPETSAALDADINSLPVCLVKVDIASMAHALEVRSPCSITDSRRWPSLPPR
jgi:hypothetical protein